MLYSLLRFPIKLIEILTCKALLLTCCWNFMPSGFTVIKQFLRNLVGNFICTFLRKQHSGHDVRLH